MDKGMAIILSALITGVITLLGVFITQIYNYRNNKINEKTLHQKNMLYKKIDKVEEIINLISEYELRVNYCGSAIVCTYTNNSNEGENVSEAIKETNRCSNEGNDIYKKLDTLMAIYLNDDKCVKFDEIYGMSADLIEQCPKIGNDDIIKSEKIVRGLRDKILEQIRAFKIEIIGDLKNILER